MMEKFILAGKPAFVGRDYIIAECGGWNSIDALVKGIEDSFKLTVLFEEFGQKRELNITLITEERIGAERLHEYMRIVADWYDATAVLVHGAADGQYFRARRSDSATISELYDVAIHYNSCSAREAGQLWELTFDDMPSRANKWAEAN